MLEKGEVARVLTKFDGNLKADSRTNLLRNNVSGRLARSLRSDLDIFKNSFAYDFFFEEYGQFLDQGVSGTETKYNTPFSYKNKMPPPRVFDRWSIRRGIAPRDERGRFLSRSSLNFALAMSKFKHGQKPTKWFTKAFEQNFAELPDDLIEAYGLDLENFMELTLNK